MPLHDLAVGTLLRDHAVDIQAYDLGIYGRSCVLLVRMRQ